MLVCDVGFLAWADGILFVVHCFFKCAAHFFYDGMLGTWLCSFISKICYRARCLRAQVMSNVVVAFWMWGWCLAVMALVWFVFIYNLRCIFVMCMRVFVYPECLRCAACSAFLSPLVLHGSRRELWASVLPFCSVGLFLFVVPLTSVILLDASRFFGW